MTIEVGGILRITDHFPIVSDAIQLTFRLEGDRVTHIVCECEIPQAKSNQSFSIADNQMSIIFDPDVMINVQNKLKVFQGALSTYTALKLNFDRQHVEWLSGPNEPRPKILNWKVGETRTITVPMDFNVLAKCFIQSPELEACTIELSLFRKASDEIDSKNYIIAYLFFFMMLERCFGDGEFKQAKLQISFKKNRKLMNHIASTSEEFLNGYDHKNDNFYLFIKDASLEKIVDKIISKRGNLSHNARKGPANWSIDEQHYFRAEANFLYYLCSNVALEFMKPLTSPEANRRYREQATSTGAIILLHAEFHFLDIYDKKSTDTTQIEVIGTKTTNAGILNAITTAIEHFDKNVVGSQLEQLNIKMEDGRTLASLQIHVEN